VAQQLASGVVSGQILALASSVVPGVGACDIQSISQGLISDTFRVTRDGAAYALRVARATANAAQFGQDPAWEARVLTAAGALGIAPALTYGDPQRGIFLSRWVEGRAWSAPETARPENIRRISALLHRVHGMPIPAPARAASPRHWLDIYGAALAQLGRASRDAVLQATAEACLATLTEPPASAGVLCHSDLHTLNLLESGASLILLDWEYAHVADPLWDVAGWCANNDFAEDSQRDLLRHYLGMSPSALQWTRLRKLRWLYDYVGLLWSELYLALRPDPGSIAERARQLDARLRLPAHYAA
jgi:thiamine kinase